MPCSAIRAGGSAYPAPMRRLLLVLVVTAVAVALYRHRTIGRHEQELAIGPYADDVPG